MGPGRDHGPADVTFRRADPAQAPARTLIEAMMDELEVFYGRLDLPGRPTATPDELRPPHGSCIVGFDPDDEPICVGALKRLEDGVAEIKRMYVAPAARGRGVARSLLGALEDEARSLGYARARLDTGPRQPHARALYESAGYEEITDYNGNPAASFWGEKAL